MPDNAPLVSIITPCLNPGAKLSRCLDSVAAQTYDNIEHIVIDGGSTDGTLDLLTSSRAAFVSEDDDGQTHAINKGAGKASGEILTWLNADDHLRPEAVAAVVRAFAGTDARWVHGGGHLTGGTTDTIVWGPKKLRRRHLGRGFVVCQPSSFFQRSLFESVGGLDQRFDLTMDLDLWIRFIRSGARSIRVGSVLAEVDIHAASKSAQASPAKWYIEAANSYLKASMATEASIALGRASVYLDLDDDVSDPWRVPQVQDALFDPAWIDAITTRPFRAGRRFERARRDYGAGPKRLRHLAAIEPWLYYATRSQLVDKLRRASRGEI